MSRVGGATMTTKARPLSELLLLLALGLLASACRRASAAQDTAGNQSAPAPHVEMIAAVEQDVPRYLFVTGSLAPMEEADVAAGIAGRVFSTYVERGMSVSKGAPLAALDRRSASAAALETEAQARVAATQLRVAEQDCKRARRLVASGAINGAEADRVQGQCDEARDTHTAAEAREELASVALGDATVRAPFAGVIAERFVSSGEYVAASTRVATVMSIDSLRVELTLPESAVMDAHEGTPIDFSVTGDHGFPRHAVIRYVGPGIQKSARDQVVEAIVANEDHRLRPGLFAIARLAVGSSKLPIVPRAALSSSDGVERVLVVDNGVVARRIVATDDSSSDSIPVTVGLRAGERVVVPYADLLQDGTRVE
jgi:membrane fusion protein (multidrug efflux system)